MNFGTNKSTNGKLRHETSQTERMVTVLKGRLETGMPNFDASKMANDNIAALCAYLKGRSDGAIEPGRLEELK